MTISTINTGISGTISLGLGNYAASLTMGPAGTAVYGRHSGE
jgi:hypothetical protein